MSATIILAGENARARRVRARCEALGIEAAGASGSGVIDLVRQARERGAQGMLALSEPAALACAQACRELGLPGPLPEAVRRMLDKGLMREALRETNTDVQRFAVVDNPDAARTEAKRLRPPWVIKPATGDRQCGVSFIAYADDLPIGYMRARAQSRDGRVLIDEYVQGEEFVVDGIVRGGVLDPLCVSSRLRPAPPMLHDLGMEAPVAANAASPLIAFGERVVAALGYDDGPVRIEVVGSGGAMHTIEVSPVLCGGRLETDLGRVAHGADAIDAALLACTGADAPRPEVRERGAALLWIPARSGVVEAVRGVDAARAAPGVVEVEVNARAGDWIGHALIRQTNERIGHVVAEGIAAEEAMAAARLALERCTVETRPTLAVG